MAQGKAILEGCTRLLQQQGIQDVMLLQKHGAPDEILAELSDIRLMVLGRKGSEHKVGSHLENVIRLQKNPLLVVPDKFSTPSRVMFAYDGSEESRKNLERLTVSPLLKDLPCHIVMINGDEGDFGGLKPNCTRSVFYEQNGRVKKRGFSLLFPLIQVAMLFSALPPLINSVIKST